MPSPSLSRQFHDLENRTEALEGRIGNLEDSLCPACKTWAPSTMTARELKSIRLKRTARFQELMGLFDQAKAQGMTHKIWRTVGGASVRASHMVANNQKVKIDEKFKIGTKRLFLPTDPSASLDETANCRCGVKYVREEDGKASARSVSSFGIEFIKRHEGFEPFPTGDPINLSTVGYGHKLTETEKANGTFDKGLTRAQAEALLHQDIFIVEAAIAKQITVPLTQNQFDAVASLIFNIGAAKFSEFNLRREINAGNFEAAAREFLDIVKAGGRVLPGLVTRRREDSQLFLTPDR